MGAARMTLIILNMTQLTTVPKISMPSKKERLARGTTSVRLRAGRSSRALPIGPRVRTKSSSVSADAYTKGEVGTAQELKTFSVFGKPLRSLKRDSRVSSPGCSSLRLEEKLIVTTASASGTSRKGGGVSECGRQDGGRISKSSTLELSSVGLDSSKSLVSHDDANTGSTYQSFTESKKSSQLNATSVHDSRSGFSTIANDDHDVDVVVSPSATSELQSKGPFPVQSEEQNTVDAESASMASLSCRVEEEAIETPASSPRQDTPSAAGFQSMRGTDRPENSYGQAGVLTPSVSMEELGVPAHASALESDFSPGSVDYPDLFRQLTTATADDKATHPAAASRCRKHEVVNVTHHKKRHHTKSDSAGSFAGRALPVESLRGLEVVRSDRTQSPGMKHSRLRKKLVVAPRKTRLWADMSVRKECATGGELAVSVRGCLLNTSPGPCKKDRMCLRDYAIVGIPIGAARKLLDASQQAVGASAVSFSGLKIVRKDRRRIWLRVDINETAMVQGEIRADSFRQEAFSRKRRPSLSRQNVVHFNRLRLIGMGLKEMPCVLVLTPSASVLVESGVSFAEARKRKASWKLELGLAACHIVP